MPELHSTEEWARLQRAEELLTGWFRWWRDTDDAPAKMPDSLHTRTIVHLTQSAHEDGRHIMGAGDL